MATMLRGFSTLEVMIKKESIAWKIGRYLNFEHFGLIKEVDDLFDTIVH